MRKEFAKTLRFVAFFLAFCCTMGAVAQVNVKGTVKDGSGDPLIGATVMLKGNASVATATDIDGNFTLKVPNLQSTLLVTYIGMQTAEVKLNGRSTVEVTLENDSQLLDEVVAVGYGTAKKVTLTGSVSAINSKELLTAPMTNTSNMLTGKIAGLTAVQTSGRPGSDQASIHVRGLNDFAGSGPLCIVDGVPSDMNNVNPNDIESVSVLKDAAAAIYGVQGANGVILITTKKGNDGQARITYNGTVSMVNNTFMPEMMNASEFMYWHNKASVMDGLTPRYTADIQQQVFDNDPESVFGESDWTKTIWRTAFTQQHNISAAGGTQKVKYFVSLGYLDQDGTMKNTSYKRYNVRSNIDITVAKNLTFSTGISGYKADRYAPGFDLGSQYFYNPAWYASHNLPIYKIKYKDEYMTTGTGSPGNPLAVMENSGWQRNYNNQIMTNYKLEYDFKDLVPVLQGLKISLWGAYNYGQTKIRNYMGSWFQYTINTSDPYSVPNYVRQDGTTEGGAFTKLMQASDGWILRPQIDYNRTFGKHTVSALYVYEAQKNSSDSMQASANQYAATDPVDLNLGVIINTDANHPVGSYGYTSMVSHIGRLTYDYDNKYLLDFTFRYDGSYKFAPENRWGFFPSVSAGWVISSESFLAENAPWIDFLKLRASWGKSGKDNITPYLYNATFLSAANSIVFGNSLYKQFYTNTYLQRNLKWSTTETYDIGLDFDVLGRKLGLELDVYYQYTNNLLQSISGEYAPSLGGNYPSQANTGSMDNRGLDFTIKHQLTVTKDFNYRLRGTFGFARNKVLQRNLSHNYPTSLQPRVGESLYVRYGYKTNGLYRTEEELKYAPYLDVTSWSPHSDVPRLGDIRYVDVNGDGIIRHNDNNTQVLDMVRIGYGELPEIQFSLSGDFNYKDFYLNMLFQGVGHCDYMLSGNYGDYQWVVGSMLNVAFDSQGNGVKYISENSWTPENPNAKYPRLTTNSGGNNILYSDYWMVNGEYLRLKTLTLGYNVPARALTKTPFSAVNVFVSGTNVFTLSHCKYVDPETPSVSFNLYPQQQTWSLGLNVSF